jgi:hypothetical protein
MTVAVCGLNLETPGVAWLIVGTLRFEPLHLRQETTTQWSLCSANCINDPDPQRSSTVGALGPVPGQDP